MAILQVHSEVFESRLSPLLSNTDTFTAPEDQRESSLFPHKLHQQMLGSRSGERHPRGGRGLDTARRMEGMKRSSNKRPLRIERQNEARRKVKGADLFLYMLRINILEMRRRPPTMPSHLEASHAAMKVERKRLFPPPHQDYATAG